MCLIIFSYDIHPEFRLILAANRDEYYVRPTQPLRFWEDCPNVLAGRDLKSRGTWLGLSRTGRISALTNYRDPGAHKENAPSRGLLVSEYLRGNMSSLTYLQHLRHTARQYNGFNLIVGDIFGLYCYSNRTDVILRITPGLYGLSNHLLNSPWPKVEKGKTGLEALLKDKSPLQVERIFSLLSDRRYPADATLPDTGVGLEWERMLSPIFIAGSVYGTRCSSVILVKKNGQSIFAERSFVVNGSEVVEEKTVTMHFAIPRGSLPPVNSEN